MKKIPTLFEKIYDNGKAIGVENNVKPELEWVIQGLGIATVKYDGSCCCIMDGTFYKRYDAKHGKVPPEGAIPCCEPDKITGHWPHWVKIDFNEQNDKWHVRALENFIEENNLQPGEIEDGTYEVVGPHFRNNPYNLERDTLIKHGENKISELNNGPRSFEKIREYLKENAVEGVVFWKDGEPHCKIRRKDFGFKWPVD